MKMTAEGLENARLVAETNPDVPWTSKAVLKMLDHIAALEAEAAKAREKALEEAATYCDDRAQAAMDACRETRSAKVHASLGRIAERMHDAGEGIRALKSKPAQEPEPGVADYCPEASAARLDGEWKEMAFEENDLLPPKRRREHEYGEERPGLMGSTIAECVIPSCEAVRFKYRGGKRTCFRQSLHAPVTNEPGPCEVEP